MSMCSIYKLPIDNLLVCSHYLSVADVISLGSTSRRLNRFSRSPAVWEMLYRRLMMIGDDFSPPSPSSLVEADPLIAEYRRDVILCGAAELGAVDGHLAAAAIVKQAARHGGERIHTSVATLLELVARLGPTGNEALLSLVLPTFVAVGKLVRSRMGNVHLVDVNAVREAAEDAEAIPINRSLAALSLARKHSFNLAGHRRVIVVQSIMYLRVVLERFVMCHQLAQNVTELSGHSTAENIFQSLVAVLRHGLSAEAPLQTRRHRRISFDEFTLGDLFDLVLMLSQDHARRCVEEAVTAVRLAVLHDSSA